jgi:hypothetical protein
MKRPHDTLAFTFFWLPIGLIGVLCIWIASKCEIPWVHRACGVGAKLFAIAMEKEDKINEK